MVKGDVKNEQKLACPYSGGHSSLVVLFGHLSICMLPYKHFSPMQCLVHIGLQQMLPKPHRTNVHN